MPENSYGVTFLVDYTADDKEIEVQILDCELDKPELGTWPPYAFALLLIYFLQQMNNPVLPVLHEMVVPKPGLSEEIVHSASADLLNPSCSLALVPADIPNPSTAQMSSLHSTHSSRPTVETSEQGNWWKLNANVTECETLWCIQTMVHHNSLRNAESSVRLFKRMFHDSSTATDMRLGKDKISYSIVRRGTYMAVTCSSTFPMKFCNVRWLENVDVAKRAMETFDNLKKFVDYISTHKTMKATASSASFKVISCSLKDKLLRPKLAFFLSLAEDLEPFLKEFQSDSPMSPFLHGNLLNILKTCMGRVVKDDVLGSTLLQKIDLKKEENLKGARDIDIGYATCSALRKCHGVKDLYVLLFQQDCRTCLKNVVDKLLERSPLKFPLTEALTYLNPYKIGFNQDEAVQQMTSAMDILVTSNLIPASVAQNADREYKELQPTGQELNESCTYASSPLAIERGLSINGEVIVEHLKEDSIVAQRIVYDAVMDAGGINNFVVPRDLLLSMRSANMRWKQALENQRLKQTAEDKAKAEKRKAGLLAKELEAKKQRLLLEEALLLVKKLNSKYLGYTYSSSKFAGEQGLPVCCSICHQTGHDFHNCKEDSLEAFAYILPPMENHFMSAIITFCHQIEVEWAASEEDITIRQQIVAEMETFIANEMKGAQLNVFGSSCNGFGLRKSDLDICLTFVNNKTGKLERPEQPQHVIDGYETYFFEDLKRLPHIWPGYGENVSTVGELWLQFLKFYVNFDFKSNVVSIRLQEPLSCFEKLWTSKCMAIEDPFELSHNLGAHISKKICVGTFLLTQTFTALVIGDGNEIKRLGSLGTNLVALQCMIKMDVRIVHTDLYDTFTLEMSLLVIRRSSRTSCLTLPTVSLSVLVKGYPDLSSYFSDVMQHLKCECHSTHTEQLVASLPDGLGWLQLVLSPVRADKTRALPMLVGRGEGVHASSGNIIE
uniref:Polymerase nucleotidyl transferase domain-containing protein n=1 Tax=Timema douglasi TaxID=61478 RepID=A0A7R8VEK3_TIMDO|nr:unnamed protein product [Timema douglasi]